ncbi:MAG: hypothetical protein A2074_04165 [Candidatus Aquicultor primus]|uniref:HD-GYP domain-containing protein n=1 Tax=Candidatus Aquicultor primus TaxID=1797195 RepID=A0A1F2UFV6_9ACTN|nr:MAG: hypothetical protein A2074_04165 [Candidatus Aquicultor primus]
MTVADSFDAMTSTRSYRPAMSVEEAAEELMACSNRQFDGEVVEAFMRTLDLSLDEVGPEIKELQLSIAVENPA